MQNDTLYIVIIFLLAKVIKRQDAVKLRLRKFCSKLNFILLITVVSCIAWCQQMYKYHRLTVRYHSTKELNSSLSLVKRIVKSLEKIDQHVNYSDTAGNYIRFKNDTM